MNDDTYSSVSAPDKSVCGSCVGDVAFERFVNEQGDDVECDASQQDVCEFMMEGISLDFGEPASVGMIRCDGEWFGELYETEDVLSRAGYYPNVDYLYDDILEAFAQMDGGWAETHQQCLSPDHALRTS